MVHRRLVYIFVECAQFLQSLFQQNETNVSFREIARLIARNSSSFLEVQKDKLKRKKTLGLELRDSKSETFHGIFAI